MKTYIKVLTLMILGLTLNGCFLTKAVTVPMRVGGAAISVIPGVGEITHDAIDKAAETVDKIPL